MQQLRHPAPAACRAGGQGAGGGVAIRGALAGHEPATAPPVPQNTALYWSFPGTALDVSMSRRWLAAAVEQAWGPGEDTDRVVLAYSEVATNAVVHGRGPVTVAARIRDGAVTCEVADCSDATPQYRYATGEDVCGRGLDLVAETVDRFRVRADEVGKTVSFEVGRRTAAPAGSAMSGRSPLPRSGPGPVGPRSASSESVLEPARESVLESAREPVPEPHRAAESAHSSVGGPAGGSTDGGNGGTG
ncbi:putative anti-sigma regulatory factor, serine/threonine protein kinase [Catenulispora acidiphila DSM 44928]|uniref:Putative anti-sigma regulatory factor, serine/threonine protein kinase n=1 Tax=Catenulispora acidiphila (strain DSM 44928 / JCM 14897 / NBRC 102108 / NRRL B-24433 / ID139908) TaxID=479433 RepID=C7PX34_CATAD|nr:ATP-binding protein [Catenulispora acidiphila]ACU77291.1 putative anti-sigma regulatory factor, serine/threonine protein kinase [Catenulispora acidiphila DSM 44928]